MGLVRMLSGGRVKYIPNQGVWIIVEVPVEGGRPTSVVRYRLDDRNDDWGEEVDGTPDEVHAALFPGPVILTTEDREDISVLEVDTALNPATYAQEWQNHSPNCARAMAWALGLVRARLGVGA